MSLFNARAIMLVRLSVDVRHAGLARKTIRDEKFLYVLAANQSMLRAFFFLFNFLEYRQEYLSICLDFILIIVI